MRAEVDAGRLAAPEEVGDVEQAVRHVRPRLGVAGGRRALEHAAGGERGVVQAVHQAPEQGVRLVFRQRLGFALFERLLLAGERVGGFRAGRDPGCAGEGAALDRKVESDKENLQPRLLPRFWRGPGRYARRVSKGENYMKRMAILAGGALALTACGGGAEEAGDANGAAADETGAAAEAAGGGGTTGGVPQVAERYQRAIDRAWDRASKGDSPHMACAPMFGGAIATAQRDGASEADRAEALAAMEACYVDASVHYARTKLATDETPCIGLLRMMTVMRNSLGTMFEEAGAERAAYDARIAEALGDDLAAACPDQAGAILGTR